MKEEKEQRMEAEEVAMEEEERKGEAEESG